MPETIFFFSSLFTLLIYHIFAIVICLCVWFHPHTLVVHICLFSYLYQIKSNKIAQKKIHEKKEEEEEAKSNKKKLFYFVSNFRYMLIEWRHKKGREESKKQQSMCASGKKSNEEQRKIRTERERGTERQRERKANWI